MALLHATMDAAYVGNVIEFFLEETMAHFSIAVLTISLICIIKRGEIASIICLFLMVFGYVTLSGVEKAFSFGEVITDFWAFSQTAFVEFNGPVAWGRILISLLGHLVICSLIAIAFLSRKDID